MFMDIDLNSLKVNLFRFYVQIAQELISQRNIIFKLMENKGTSKIQNNPEMNSSERFCKRQLPFGFKDSEADNCETNLHSLSAPKKQRKPNQSPQKSIAKDQDDDFYNQQFQLYNRISLYSVNDEPQDLDKSKSQLCLLANFTEYRSRASNNQPLEDDQKSDRNILQQLNELQSESCGISGLKGSKMLNFKQELLTITIEDGQVFEISRDNQTVLEQDFRELKIIKDLFPTFSKQNRVSFFCNKIQIKRDLFRRQNITNKVIELNLQDGNCFLQIIDAEFEQVQRINLVQYKVKRSVENPNTIRFEAILKQRHIDQFTISFQYESDANEMLEQLRT